MRTGYGFARLVGCLLVLGLLVPALAGQGLVQSYPKCQAVVDWEASAATVRGHAPLAKGAGAASVRRARAAALRNAQQNAVSLSEVIVPFAGTAQRKRAMANEARQAATRAKVVAWKRLPDGRLEVAIRMPLVGRSGLSGRMKRHLRRMPTMALLPRSAVGTRDMATTTGEEKLLTPADAKGPFTGLIVDARGFGIQTAMSPVVYDSKNKEVYGGRFADADFVEEVGIVGYMGSIKAATGTSRVGKTPLVLRATGSPDQFHRCLSVSDEDAARIRAADKAAGFLKKCAVTIVIDKAASAAPESDS